MEQTEGVEMGRDVFAILCFLGERQRARVEADGRLIEVGLLADQRQFPPSAERTPSVLPARSLRSSARSSTPIAFSMLPAAS